jgi:hypothetical protein
MARFVGRENVRKRLAPFEGEQGRTSYANGMVRIELPGEAIVVRPPFGLAHEAQYETVRLAPLFAAIADDHIVAALLVRLGGYAVGVFDGERLVASKVGSRFVKNRHKKGGSSANRFPPAPRGVGAGADRRSGGDRRPRARALARPCRVRRPRRRPWRDQRGTRSEPGARLAVGAGNPAVLHRPGTAPARARAAGLRALLRRAHHQVTALQHQAARRSDSLRVHPL